MLIALTALVFFALTGCFSWLMLRFWVRPQGTIARVTGAGVRAPVVEKTTTHPSLVFRDLLKRLGDAMPASPKDVSLMQRRLIRAGLRSDNALKYLYGAKVLLGILFPVAAFIAISGSDTDGSYKLLLIVAALALGYFLPNEYLKVRIRRRQREIRRGLPNALDLLVVCVESGLGLDQGLLQVARELEHAHPEITEELALVNLELKAGKRRVEALRNLAERTNVEDLKKLVAVLIQADRFGTGIAQSLRGHAEFMRIQARQAAEEKAAKLGVKLVFPIFFCILPSLFVVTVGPMVIRVIRELLPMMQNM